MCKKRIKEVLMEKLHLKIGYLEVENTVFQSSDRTRTAVMTGSQPKPSQKLNSVRL